MRYETFLPCFIGPFIMPISYLYFSFQCGQDFNTAIKLLQDHVCETQGIQIRESLATKSANQKGTKSYVQKFMDFEFALRNLLSTMRKIVSKVFDAFYKVTEF